MLYGLFITALIDTCVQGIKEALKPTIPAENWANKELYHNDMMAGVSMKQRMKNLKNGKYKKCKLVENYPEPHRDSASGKIIIENCKLYKEDIKKYDAYQVQKWVHQGKYNLSPEELAKERERYKKEIEYLYSLL